MTEGMDAREDGPRSREDGENDLVVLQPQPLLKDDGLAFPVEVSFVINFKMVHIIETNSMPACHRGSV